MYTLHEMLHKLKSVRRYRIFFGRSSTTVPAGSLIIFPYYANRLHCGLMGILEYKEENPSTEAISLKPLPKSLKKIKKSNVKDIISSTIEPDYYLGGDEEVHNLQSLAISLKDLNAFESIFKDSTLQDELRSMTRDLKKFIADEQMSIKKEGIKLSSLTLEGVNQKLMILKDIAWWFEEGILLDITKIAGMITGAHASASLIRNMKKINIMLNNIDRLEVRGRDSAGLSVMVIFPDMKVYEDAIKSLTAKGLMGEYEERQKITNLHCRSITDNSSGILTFVYKTAQEIGHLGENVTRLRAFIGRDTLLHELLGTPHTQCQVLAHTRWASVGEISEENCHPLNNKDLSRTVQIHAVLNGDIDNFIHLKERLLKEDGEMINERVTTDAKIIPLWVEHYLRLGCSLAEAFRLAVNDFDGSHAIALQSDSEPGRFYLAQKGSGQAIFVGLCRDSYLIASEVYGFVEQTSSYLKLNQGTDDSHGQIYILDSSGGLEGITAFDYDGFPVTLTRNMILSTEISTRDIDRQNFPHYFLKEVTQAPSSVQKTLSGRVLVKKYGDGRERRALFNLGDEIISKDLSCAFKSGKIKYIYLIGQGTAGIAAAGIAFLLREYLSFTAISILEKKASELSGFGLDKPLNDALVIAVTQSGTTTDTNKALDLAKERGAYTIAIVNRRNSDITYKAQGIFYTSDGRDIEMSVASTKAFYSQIVAGCILGLRLAQILETKTEAYIASEVQALYRLPKLMNNILCKQREAIEESARKLCLGKKHWAVVGSGPNKIAADEVRIKLSELCYKTLPSDVVEDRKHIDLSAEPLIVVCAAGNRETVLGDIVKDTAIFQAHKATTICIIDEKENRFDDIASSILKVPHFENERLSPILNTMVGHLWGYYAAIAINEIGDFFKDFRKRLRERMNVLQNKGKNQLEMMLDAEAQKLIKEFEKDIVAHKTNRHFNGVIEADTISDLILAIKYIRGNLPLMDISADLGSRGNPYDCLTLFLQIVDKAVNEFSRPIDAIKHQAKTVTVGTSRLPEVITGPVFDYIIARGFELPQLDFNIVRKLKNIQPVIDSIHASTLYEVRGLDPRGLPTDASTIHVLSKEGAAKDMFSRVERNPALRGTKRLVIKNNVLYCGVGLWDKAQIIIFPIYNKDKKTDRKYLMVLHITYREKGVSLEEKIAAMGVKYEEIVDNLAEELNIDWDDHLLEEFNTSYLMSQTAEDIIKKIAKLQLKPD
ncbi:MAG: SIS domain-containing protein [bacterium]